MRSVHSDGAYRRSEAIAAAALAAVLLFASCERRELRRAPGGLTGPADVRQLELQPGVPMPVRDMRNPYAGNPHALADGKRLYDWYNCSGCHFAGGGGIGPPLMDEDWIYGGAPQNILDSILEGRANGMPSYGGKIAHEDALKIVAYVRSLAEERQPAAEAVDRKQEDTAENRQGRSAAGERQGQSQEEHQSGSPDEN